MESRLLLLGPSDTLSLSEALAAGLLGMLKRTSEMAEDGVPRIDMGGDENGSA